MLLFLLTAALPGYFPLLFLFERPYEGGKTKHSPSQASLLTSSQLESASPSFCFFRTHTKKKFLTLYKINVKFHRPEKEVVIVNPSPTVSSLESTLPNFKLILAPAVQLLARRYTTARPSSLGLKINITLQLVSSVTHEGPLTEYLMAEVQAPT